MGIILTILKYIGIIIASAVVVVAILIFGFRFWLCRNINKTLGMDSELYFLLNATVKIYPRLNLYRIEEKPVWAQRKAMEKMINEAKQLGFISLGSYNADITDDIQMHIMDNQELNLSLILYDAEQLPTVKFDLYTFYQDGIGNYLTTNPVDRPIAKGDTYWVNPDATLESGIQEILEKRQEGDFLSMDEKTIVPLLEQKYADQMDEIIHQNFPLDTNFNQALETLGDKVPQEVAESMREEYEMSYEEAVNTIAIEYLLKSGKLTALKWNEIQHDVIVVYERMPLDRIGTYFEDYFTDNDIKNPIDSDDHELINQFKTDPLECFSHLNGLILNENAQFKPLGDISYPLKAVFYQAPKWY